MWESIACTNTMRYDFRVRGMACDLQCFVVGVDVSEGRQVWGGRRRSSCADEQRHPHASHIADYEKAKQLRDLLRSFFFLWKFSAHIDGVDDGDAAP
jgi:hypothetical protein